MPRELAADVPGKAILRAYEEAPLEPGQIRVRSRYSAVKHGTEFRAFQADTADATDRFDMAGLRIHLRGEKNDRFPMTLGNMFIGEVIEVAPDVDSISIGDVVYGRGKVRQTHTVAADSVWPVPDGVTWQSLCYIDPTHPAISGVRDSHLRIGDRATVHGLGAIGQMCVQLCRLQGASLVVGVDPIERRREAATRHGADVVLDPTEADVGFEVKTMTDGLGVDAAIEVSGDSGGMYDALRSVKYLGRISSIAYYKGGMSDLLFSGEWHRNRITIVSSRSDSVPNPDHGWDQRRIWDEATRLHVGGRLKTDGLIDPVVPFSQAGEAYMEMNAHPENGIKLGIDHTCEW